MLARRDARPDADPRAAAASTRAAPRSPTGGRRGRRRRRLPRHGAATVLPAEPRATTSPATWWRPGRVRGPGARVSPAGGAAARAVRRPRRRGRASASGCCFASGPASAGSTTSASTQPGRLAVVDVVGESVRGHARRRRRAARGVQRLPAPRLPAGPDASRAPSRVCCGGRGAALPVPLVDLLAGRPAAAGAAHRRTATSTRPTSRCTRSGSRSGRASSSCTSRRRRASRFADGVARAGGQPGATTTWARW